MNERQGFFTSKKVIDCVVRNLITELKLKTRSNEQVWVLVHEELSARPIDEAIDRIAYFRLGEVSIDWCVAWQTLWLKSNVDFIEKLKRLLLTEPPNRNGLTDDSEDFDAKINYARKRLTWLQKKRRLGRVKATNRPVGFKEVFDLAYAIQKQLVEFRTQTSTMEIVDGWILIARGDVKYILGAQLQKSLIVNRPALLSRIKKMGAFYEGCIVEANTAEIEFIASHGKSPKRETTHELIALECLKRISEMWVISRLPAQIVQLMQNTGNILTE